MRAKALSRAPCRQDIPQKSCVASAEIAPSGKAPVSKTFLVSRGFSPPPRHRFAGRSHVEPTATGAQETAWGREA